MWKLKREFRRKGREIKHGKPAVGLLKQKIDGSYTVEAAFIVPVLLGLAFVIMYILFLLHDKAILQANLDNVIFLLAEGEEIEKKEYEIYLSQALWFLGIQEIEIKNKKTVISGKVKANTNLEIPVLTYFMNKKQEIVLSDSYYKIQPEMIIRFGEGILKKRGEDGEK